MKQFIFLCYVLLILHYESYAQFSNFEEIKNKTCFPPSSKLNVNTIDFYLHLTCDSDSVSLYVDNQFICGKKVIRNPTDDRYTYLGQMDILNTSGELLIVFHRHKKKAKQHVDFCSKKILFFACVTNSEDKIIKNDLKIEGLEEVEDAIPEDQVEFFFQ